MAHSCWDCGQLCHCGGDIDDCEFDDSPEARACTHCCDLDDECYDDVEETPDA